VADIGSELYLPGLAEKTFPMTTSKSVEEVPRSVELPAIAIEQPLGTFFIAAIESSTLCEIASADVRRMVRERPFETYLGIQRPLDPKRVEALQKYVRTSDACFPTSVVLAVSGRCAEFDKKRNILVLHNYLPEKQKDKILWIEIANVLDGQHRIEGLRGYSGAKFQVNVSIFVDADIEDQAYLFSTVNLTQTKVSKSLVYDLFDLAKKRSPQKTAHNIAVALDRDERSPFHLRIKRLGSATPGRVGELLTQATVVEALLPYITSDPIMDRELYIRGKRPSPVFGPDLEEMIFRNMFIEERDLEILDIVWNYFTAVKKKWPAAWGSKGQGNVLPRSMGFRALMRLLKPVYLHISGPGEVPEVEDFAKVINKAKMKDDEFNVDEFKPGSSGEALLANTLAAQLNVKAP
jgi:DGQHR domain-containing protein